MDKGDFNREIKIIKQIAKNNGYNIEIIDRLIERHKNKKNNSFNSKADKNKYIGSKYTTKLPSALRNTMKKYGYNIGFRTDNKLEKHFKKKKTQK